MEQKDIITIVISAFALIAYVVVSIVQHKSEKTRHKNQQLENLESKKIIQFNQLSPHFDNVDLLIELFESSKRTVQRVVILQIEKSLKELLKENQKSEPLDELMRIVKETIDSEPHSWSGEQRLKQEISMKSRSPQNLQEIKTKLKNLKNSYLKI